MVSRRDGVRITGQVVTTMTVNGEVQSNMAKGQCNGPLESSWVTVMKDTGRMVLLRAGDPTFIQLDLDLTVIGKTIECMGVGCLSGPPGGLPETDSMVTGTQAL